MLNLTDFAKPGRFDKQYFHFPITFTPSLLILQTWISNGIVVFSKTDFIAFPTFVAFFMPWLNANIDGPEPEIPEPKAPFSKATFLISLKCGINLLLNGSTISSCKLRPINS